MASAAPIERARKVGGVIIAVLGLAILYLHDPFVAGGVLFVGWGYSFWHR